MTEPIALEHEGCGTGHIAVGSADSDLRNALAIAADGVHQDNLEPSPWHHEPAWALTPEISAASDTLGPLPMGLGQESDREGEVMN